MNTRRMQQNGPSTGFKRTENPNTQIGSVVRLNNQVNTNQGLSPFTVTLNNSAGTQAADYIIGDPSGLVAAVIGGTYSNPDSCSAGTSVAAVTAFKESLGNRPVIVNQFNYQTTVSSTQFSNSFKFVQANIAGESNPKPINVEAARRNSAFDPKLLTIDTTVVFAEGYALTLRVNAGETVVLTFTPSAYFTQGGL